MTDPRTPDEQPLDPGTGPTPSTPTPPAEAAGTDSPTQAWPSLATPAADASGSTAAPTPAGGAPESTSTSPYEPADTLPATRVDAVASTPAGPTSRRPGVRWIVAGLAVVLVAAASFVIVSLVGSRPATSVAMGYMPADTFSYSEFRLDLPGDQRQKLASFLKPFPGFDDPSAIEPKLNDVFDRIVRAATDGKQTWTADIKPWFGGQIAIGAGLPDPAALSSGAASQMAGANAALFVATVSDRAKATAWLSKTADTASTNQTTYNGADLFTSAEGGGQFAIAVTDKAMLGGSAEAVKAAVDSGGKTAFVDDNDVKAALATVDKDYVALSVIRVHVYADWIIKAMSISQPGILDRTQIDETVVEMLPAWFANVGRFENDAFVSTSVGPAGKVGYDTSNRADQLVGHVPAGTIFFASEHDVGPTLAAVLAKFKELPETQQFFAQMDQGLSLLGGFDAVFGWWQDTALVVSKLDDGTIGGGLVIHPRDAAAPDRLLTTLNGFLALGGSSAGVNTRTEDHNGTKVTILDFSAMPGMSSASLPPGYKPEFAWASNKDVTVLGYGESFVNAVLDAGPGHSLADDARFKALLDRAGSENIAVSFVDLNTIRTLIEPFAESAAPPDAWAYYTREIKPYLEHVDALIATGRKEGGLDRGVTILTAH